MLGIQREPTQRPREADLDALIDRVAALTAGGDDASIGELLSLAESDGRLRPPAATIEAGLAADRAGPTAGNPISTT